MARDTIAYLATATGELFHVDEQRRPARSYGVRFVTMFDDVLARMTANITSAPTFRVLMCLPRLLDFETWRRLDQCGLAKQLGIAQASVSRSMADLLTRKIVEKRGSGAHIEWRLSLEWGWRGNVETWHAARASRTKPKTPPKPRPAVVAEGILWKEHDGNY